MSKRVLGLDMGGTTARLVEGRLSKGAFEIHTAVSVPQEELAETLSSMGLKGLPVAVGVTGRDMILRMISVPPVPLWQLRELMEFEVADIAEQSGDALRGDFNILSGVGAFSDEEMALLAVVRSSHVEERTALFEAAPLKVTGFTPNAVALHNAVVATDGGDGTVLCVNLRGQHTDIALIHDGELLFARNLAGGGDNFTEAVANGLRVTSRSAQQAKERLGGFATPGRLPEGQAGEIARALEGSLPRIVGMLQSTLTLARTQLSAPNLEVDRVLLCGSGASVPGLDQALTRTLGLPVARFDPTEGYVVGEAPELDERGSDFAVATGLAMMALLDDGYRVVILSERGEKAAAFRDKTLWLLLSGVLVLAYLGLYAWTSKADYDAVLIDRAALSRKVESNKADVRAYERAVAEGQQLGTRLSLIEEAAAPGAGLLTVLDLLEAHLPEELWVNSVRTVRAAEPEFGKGGAPQPFLVVEGGGKEMSRNLADAVIEITTRLRAHPDIAAVLPQFAPDVRGGFAFELRVDTSVSRSTPEEDGEEASTEGEVG
ncbi:MAG: pilus assembly protein PilM [Planctomycetota bacterium]|nr:pilus assembly protein PilM [Planctomycetota bacterium]